MPEFQRKKTHFFWTWYLPMTFKFFFISDHLGRGRLCLKIVFPSPLCHSLQYLMKVLVAQSCPTLCNPTDCSPPGSSVHGLFQARILEWVAISFSRGSSQPRNRTPVSKFSRLLIYVTMKTKHTNILKNKYSDIFSMRKLLKFLSSVKLWKKNHSLP